MATTINVNGVDRTVDVDISDAYLRQPGEGVRGLRCSVRPEQAHQLLAGRHRQAVKDAPLALGEDALDQRLIVVDPGAPAHRRDPEVGQPFDGYPRS